ncbi:MAG: anti-sigma regulatory factor (Ser/Thr protein kinase) [Gammaproteobacteria bacterium]|jgi:anti-sigma regulatory factor (Ser/Thr protein kinase)
MMPIEREISLTLASELPEINRVSRSVAQFCAANALSSAVERSLQLVLEELITNTVRHGMVLSAAPIDVRVALDEGGLRLVYVDRGKPFDPRHDLAPDTRELPIEQRSVGGLGWVLILHYCELDEYRYIDGENHYGFVLRASQG